MNGAFDEQMHSERRNFARRDLSPLNASARAETVNRTHRIVREKARRLEAQRNRVRGLWIPLTICSAMLLIICSAVWTVLDGYELNPTWIPSSTNQFLILLLWFLPVSMALLVMVWFRHSRKQHGNEAVR
ncbi:MAG TPA: hypothetical protein VFE38_10025 [Edaphobacter sp.]|nr:hypothetical protein [Edaphobacter sp.]